MKKTITMATLTAMLLSAGVAQARPNQVDKCKASKNKIAGAYYACRAKAESTAITTAKPVDYTRCAAKFDNSWNGAETKGGGLCPDTVLTAPMNAYIAAQAAEAASVIAGAPNPICGDGTINVVGEHCDGTALDGYTCASLGYDVGALKCTDTCDFDTSGCSRCAFAGSALAGGACWFQGEWGQSCDAVCAEHSLTYDPATGTYMEIGTSNSASKCAAVAALLPLPSDGMLCGFSYSALYGGGPAYSDGAGCVADRDFCLQFSADITRSFADAQGPVTSTASNTKIARICACQ